MNVYVSVINQSNIYLFWIIRYVLWKLAVWVPILTEKWWTLLLGVVVDKNNQVSDCNKNDTHCFFVEKKAGEQNMTKNQKSKSKSSRARKTLSPTKTSSGISFSPSFKFKNPKYPLIFYLFKRAYIEFSRVQYTPLYNIVSNKIISVKQWQW